MNRMRIGIRLHKERDKGEDNGISKFEWDT